MDDTRCPVLQTRQHFIRLLIQPLSFRPDKAGRCLYMSVIHVQGYKAFEEVLIEYHSIGPILYLFLLRPDEPQPDLSRSNSPLDAMNTGRSSKVRTYTRFGLAQ